MCRELSEIQLYSTGVVPWPLVHTACPEPTALKATENNILLLLLITSMFLSALVIVGFLSFTTASSHHTRNTIHKRGGVSIPLVRRIDPESSSESDGVVNLLALRSAIYHTDEWVPMGIDIKCRLLQWEGNILGRLSVTRTIMDAGTHWMSNRNENC